MAEKSVIASISQAEERHFKTLQLPALRAVVTALTPFWRQGFLLLFLSASANSQNEAQTRSKRVGGRMAAALSGKGAHSGSHGQTGAIFSSFCLSANRPPKVGPGFRPDLRPAYSRTRYLPCRTAGNLRPDTMQTAYLSSSRKGTKMVLSTRRFSMEGRYG